jgi:hypothetical protein
MAAFWAEFTFGGIGSAKQEIQIQIQVLIGQSSKTGLRHLAKVTGLHNILESRLQCALVNSTLFLPSCAFTALCKYVKLSTSYPSLSSLFFF